MAKSSGSARRSTAASPAAPPEAVQPAERRRCYSGMAGDVRAGRDFTTRVLGEWGRPGGETLRADMLLVVSELLSNAMVHADGPVELTLVRDGRTARVEVFDTGDGRPEPRNSADAAHPGGHGLHIVERLSADWGVVGHDRGKTVWAELDLPAR